MRVRDLLVGCIDAALRVAFAFSPRLYRGRDEPLPEPRRILLSRPDHIGDAILAMPALRSLRRRFPDAHITMLVASWSADLFRHNADADEVLVIDPPWWVAKRNGGLRPARRWKSWMAFFSGIRAIRRARYDLLVELRGDVRHIVAFGCLGAARRIVTYRRNGGHFLADRWIPVRDDRHEIEQGTDLVAILGGEPETRVPALHGPDDVRVVAGMLAAFGLEDHHTLVVIHPGAKRVNQWPIENYVALLPALLAHRAVRVIVTGSMAEAGLAERLREHHRTRVFTLAGAISMPQFAALLDRTALFLCADTGPMHLVNASRTRAVLLFGPTLVQRFAPLSGHVVALRGSECCARKLHETCRIDATAPYSPCMRSITVKSVAAAIDRLLAPSHHNSQPRKDFQHEAA